MAIPRAQLPETALRPVGTPYDSTRVTPDDYGAGVGQGLQKVSQDAAALYNATRQDADAAKFAELDASLVKTTDALLLDPKAGYLRLQGKDAEAGYDDAYKAIQKAHDEVIKQAKESGSEGLYVAARKRAAVLEAGAVRQMQDHAVKEAEVYGAAARKAAVEARIDSAANNWRAPAAMQEALGGLRGYAREAALKAGDPQDTAGRWEAVQKVAAEKVLRRMLADEDPAAAERLLGEPLLKGYKQTVEQLLGADGADTIKAVRTAAKAQDLTARSWSLADVVRGQAREGGKKLYSEGTLQAMLAEVGKHPDKQVAKLAEERLTALFRVDKAAEDERAQGAAARIIGGLARFATESRSTPPDPAVRWKPDYDSLPDTLKDNVLRAWQTYKSQEKQSKAEQSRAENLALREAKAAFNAMDPTDKAKATDDELMLWTAGMGSLSNLGLATLQGLRSAAKRAVDKDNGLDERSLKSEVETVSQKVWTDKKKQDAFYDFVKTRIDDEFTSKSKRPTAAEVRAIMGRYLVAGEYEGRVYNSNEMRWEYEVNKAAGKRTTRFIPFGLEDQEIPLAQEAVKQEAASKDGTAVIVLPGGKRKVIPKSQLADALKVPGVKLE